MGSSSETKVLQELLLYAASAALSYPNREATKKAVEQKKEIAKRLGRPLIQTNPYEVRLPTISLIISLLFLIFLLVAYYCWVLFVCFWIIKVAMVLLVATCEFVWSCLICCSCGLF
ncbi:unnamed protein product [Linum tenue]|uniref:Uncharacterized protein n=1 Tax=Linum tenue TaxID=586396 RepID=A0AAV0N245_9ROSI|nr:unnamed protein product [Linum tenue]